MLREYVQNVHIDIRDLEIDPKNDPFSHCFTRAQKFFEIVNFHKTYIQIDNEIHLQLPSYYTKLI